MQAIAIKRLITAHRIWTIGIVGFMLSTLIVVSAIALTREGTGERNETVADQPVTMISEMAQVDRATQIEQRRATAVTLSAAAQADLATMRRYYADKEDRLEEDEQRRSSVVERAAAEQRQLEMERQDFEDFLHRH